MQKSFLSKAVLAVLILVSVVAPAQANVASRVGKGVVSVLEVGTFGYATYLAGSIVVGSFGDKGTAITCVPYFTNAIANKVIMSVVTGLCAKATVQAVLNLGAAAIGADEDSFEDEASN